MAYVPDQPPPVGSTEDRLPPDVRGSGTPPPVGGGGGGMWVMVLVGLVVLLLVGWLIFGRPRGGGEVDIDLPKAEAPKVDAPDVKVEVPEKVQVDVKQSTP